MKRVDQGIAGRMILLGNGALQLVRIRYGAVAPPLRAVAALMSVAIAALQGVAGVVGGEAAPASVVAALCVISAALSLRVPATSGA